MSALIDEVNFFLKTSEFYLILKKLNFFSGLKWILNNNK
jgi:hypothetical protein